MVCMACRNRNNNNKKIVSVCRKVPNFAIYNSQFDDIWIWFVLSNEIYISWFAHKSHYTFLGLKNK